MTRNASPKWESQSKLIDYYLENLFPEHPNDAPFAVYTAVIEGRIRCRYSGTVYTRQQANMLSKTKWGPGYSLPADLAISVDDALEEFEEGISKIRAPDDKKSTNKITALLAKRIADDVRLSDSSKGKSRANLVSNIAELIDETWPNGIPMGLKAKERNAKIIEEAKRRGLSQPSPRTICRALVMRAK